MKKRFYGPYIFNHKTASEDTARILLGAFLAFAGTSHLTFARNDFQVQVPDLVPVNKDLTVILSGIAEILLGAALIFLKKHKKITGSTAALFFTAVFPGNISQYRHRRSAFGLDTDKKGSHVCFSSPCS